MKIVQVAAAGVSAVALLIPLGLYAQTKPSKLTARELFYTAPAQQKTAQSAKPKPPKATQQAGVRKQSMTKQQPDRPAERREPVQATLATSKPDEAFVPVAYTASARPLGLRYSILKYAGDDQYMEVDPDLIFRSGDRIRLRLQVNDPAHLYIVMKGSSGNWRVLFPSPEYDSGSNRVLPGRDYDIPSRTRFVFDETPGEEKLFFVLSRQAEADLDKLIYDLDQAGPAMPAPAAAPAKTQPVKTMMAMNTVNVSDDLVGQLRGKVMSRDLVFEKVDEKTAPPASAGASAREKAIYVVNPSTGADSRLVVDVSLKHR
ncbi:MAG: DUF4384 domain-containing protein [Bryobacteraceae bacterium]|nr:DUF4384 domain-containing protein [Bryobacteraceae bacterium]